MYLVFKARTDGSTTMHVCVDQVTVKSKDKGMTEYSLSYIYSCISIKLMVHLFRSIGFIHHENFTVLRCALLASTSMLQRYNITHSSIVIVQSLIFISVCI